MPGTTRDEGCRRCLAFRDRPVEIAMAFQPIFDMRDQSVFAYEALVRGPNGESAHSVLSSVSRRDLHAFDQLVRVTALEKAVALGWLETGARLSINFIPAAVLEARRCLQPFLRAARKLGVPTERIVFEFTESEEFDFERARAVTSAYAENGIATALDDFGARFAGLLALTEIESDYVKLDIGLIRDMHMSADRILVVKTVVDLIRKLGSEVIAEGIASPGELEALRALDVHLVQGFYLGHPSMTHLQAKPSFLPIRDVA